MKKFFIILSITIMTACGFQPMFTGQTTDIYVAPINGINGIELRNALWTEFGNQYTPDAKYTLSVQLRDPTTRYKALTQTGDAEWQEISLSATYTLTQNGKKIASGSENAAESYAFVSYLVASNASYNNAVKNVIRTLSEKISTRVIAETYKNEHNEHKDTVK
jgi:hypothetical protein